MSNECLICAETIDGVARLATVGTCNHHGICSICFLRMRSLLQDYTCPICKCELEYVIGVGPKQIDQGRDCYEHFTIWGEDAGPDHVFDHKSKMFVPKDHHKKTIEKLRVCKCQDCGQWKRDMGSLRKHIREHNKQLCALCIEHKKVFPSEHIMYTEAEYDKHLKCGDGDGSEGHPKCLFCNKRYYDKNLLFAHLEKDHYSCHICVKNGSQFKYYKNYDCLENHFRQMHYICEEKSCLEKRFVVFGNNIDYVSHLHSWHPTLQVSRNIPVSFKSYGDSEGRGENWIDNFGEGPESYIGSSTARYDGGLGGREVNGEWQVTMPQGARDPREAVRLAAARENGGEQQQQQHEHTFVATEYPSLQGQVVPEGGLIGGGGSAKWNKGGNLTGNKAEEYPALIGVERKAPLGHSRQSNWSSRIKVDKKLSVRKNATTMPARRDMLNASVASTGPVEDATYSGPFSYSLQQQIDQQLQNGTAHYGKKSQVDSGTLKSASNSSAKTSASNDATSTPQQKEIEQHALKSKNRDDLTLAEKIRIEQLIAEERAAKSSKQSSSRGKKETRGMASTVSTVSTAKRAPAVPLPPGLGLFAPPPAPPASSTATSSATNKTTSKATKSDKACSTGTKTATVTTPQSSTAQQTTQQVKKKAIAKSNAAAVGGWGAALSADGLASKKKVVKKSSLTVVKKKTSPLASDSTAATSSTSLSSKEPPPPPPPGFGGGPPPGLDRAPTTLTPTTAFSSTHTNTTLSDSDFPSFTQSQPVEKPKDLAPKKVKEEKWTKIPASKGNTNTSSAPKKAFPGQWVPSIGGSGGDQRREEVVAEPVISSTDFPSFSAMASASSKNYPSSQKIKKSGKSNFIKIS